MTVPHMSIPVRLVPGPRIPAARRGVAEPATRGSRGIRIAWIDVAIQVLGIAAIAYGVWWVVTAGVFSDGVGAFTDWYTGAVAPQLHVDLSLPGASDGVSVFVEPGAGEMLRPPQ